MFQSRDIHRSFIKLLEGSVEVSPEGRNLSEKPVPLISKIQSVFVDIGDAVRLVEEVVLSNYWGFRRRLLFFNEHLPDLFYFHSLPFDEVIKRFDMMFQVNGEVVSFVPPEDKCSFAWLSVCASLVKSVVVFTKSKGYFDVEMDGDGLSELAIKTLAYSNYKQEPTLAGLLALLAIRNNLFLNESSNGSVALRVDGLQLLREIIECVYATGVHVQCNVFEEEGMPEESMIIVWNWIQLMDAIIACIGGTKLLVDYDYCVPRLSEVFKPVTVLFRFIAEVFNNSKPISLMDMVSVLDTVGEYIGKFPSFDNFNKESLNYGESTGWIKLTKASLVSVFQIILFKIRHSCESLRGAEVGLDQRDRKKIEELIEKCNARIKSCMVFTVMVIESAVSGKLEEEYFRPLVLMRVSFSNFILNAYGCLIWHLADSSVYHFPTCDLTAKEKIAKVYAYPLSEIEVAVFQPLHFVDNKNGVMGEICDLFDDVGSLRELLMRLYRLGMGEPDLGNSPILRTQFKFLLRVCMVLETVERVRGRGGAGVTLEEWRAVVEEARRESAARNGTIYESQNKAPSSALSSTKQTSTAIEPDLLSLGDDLLREANWSWDYLESLFQTDEYTGLMDGLEDGLRESN